MGSSVPAIVVLALASASVKEWATPWSVMAIARWPHFAACAMASDVTVMASMADIFVCRWSSTRFSGALSFRTGRLAS